MSKDLQFAMLLDCYGEFLTPHQYRMMELYYCADLSLGEIAEIAGITRQGVRDGIKRGDAKIEALLQKIAESTADDPAVQEACREAKAAAAKGLELL